MDKIDDYITLAVLIFAILSAIAAITPTKKDDRVMDRIRNLLGKFRR